MVYIKSTLVGIVTVLVATILYIIYAFVMMMRTYTPPPGGEISLDLRALLSSPAYMLIAVAAFAIGFYWEYRIA